MIRVIEYRTDDNRTVQCIVHSNIVKVIGDKLISNMHLEDCKDGHERFFGTTISNPDHLEARMDKGLKYLIPSEYNEHTKARLEALGVKCEL